MNIRFYSTPNAIEFLPSIALTRCTYVKTDYCLMISWLTLNLEISWEV